MRIAVVVITRNRTESVRRCLMCLRAQSRPADEIVVVENSDDDLVSLQISREFPEICLVRVRCSRLGVQPMLRNAGLRCVGSDVVAFVDDDGYAEVSWLERIAEVYERRPLAVVVGGRVVQGNEMEYTGVEAIGRINWVRGPYGNFNALGSDIVAVSHVQGTNMSFRLKALNSAGRFDEQLCGGYASFEETEACLRVGRQSGGEVLFRCDAVVVHGEKPREKYNVRTFGLNPDYDESLARNFAYMTVRHSGLGPIRLAGILVAQIGVVCYRALFSRTKPRGGGLYLKLKSAVWASWGVISGASTALTARYSMP